MNDILNSSDRYNSSNTKYLKPGKGLQQLTKSNKRVDVWRKKNNEKIQFTWKRHNNSKKSRIDYLLLDENIMPLVSSADIRPACIKSTDHQAISFKLIKPTKRGQGYWKLNCMHLNDPIYISLIEKAIFKCTELHKSLPKADQWELKKQIKHESIEYSKLKSKHTFRKQIKTPQ